MSASNCDLIRCQTTFVLSSDCYTDMIMIEFYTHWVELNSKNISQFETLWASLSAATQQVGLSDLTAPSALKRICNSLLWLHALRLESPRKAGSYDRQPRKSLKFGFSYAGTRDEQ